MFYIIVWLFNVFKKVQFSYWKWKNLRYNKSIRANKNPCTGGNAMYLDDKRIRIISGHYGSGKTEFAVNYVSNLKEISKNKVAISDMDIVNVYFR